MQPSYAFCSNFLNNLRRLLKLPYPVSSSRRIGILVASDMNSITSTICVQLASLLSLTPYCADKSARPNSFKSGFLDDFCTYPVMSLHDELRFLASSSDLNRVVFLIIISYCFCILALAFLYLLENQFQSKESI